MKLDNSLVKSFAALNKTEETKKPSTHYGTAVVRGDNKFVVLDGSSVETPVSSAMDINHNDRVIVMIKDHKAVVTGNVTSPADSTKEAVAEVVENLNVTNALVAKKASIDQLDASNARIGTLEADSADLKTVVAGKASIGELDAAKGRITDLESDTASINELVAKKANITDLNAEKARIDTLEATSATITDLNAEKARIDSLETTSATVTQLNAEKARIDTLEATSATIADLNTEKARINSLEANALTADSATIKDLQSDTAKIHNLTADQLTSATGYIADLKAGNVEATDIAADHAAVTSLDSNYAQIDLANVNNAWIQNGVVKDASIGDAKIIGVSANKLTAGTIDASKIDVTNLNADNLTVGTINGKRIGKESISLDKLSEEVPTKDYLDTVQKKLEEQIEGAIETWTGNVVPTLNNKPASDWADYKTKHGHVGDIYYVINAGQQADGYCYRFAENVNDNTFSWVLIKDSDVTKALQDLLEAQGDISDIKAFDTQISSWKTDTTEELGSIKSRTSTLETNMGNKVETSVFNKVKQTVDENSSSITSLSNTVNTKADNSTVTTLSNTVNSVKQTADSNTSNISKLTKTVSDNEEDIENKYSNLSQDLSGFKTTVGNTYHKTSDFNTFKAANDTAVADAKKAGTDASSALSAYKTTNDAAVANAKKAGDDAQDALDAYKATVEETYASKSALTQTESSIKQEVSSTYTTNTTFNNFKTSNTQEIADAKKAGTDASSALNSYKTTNDNVVQGIRNDLDNLEIGGRNLLLNTGDLTKWNKEAGIVVEWDESVGMYKITDLMHSSSRWGIWQNFVCEPNTTYSISVTGKRGTEGNAAALAVGFYNEGDTIGWPGDQHHFGDEKERFSFTFTTTTQVVGRIYLPHHPDAANDYYYMFQPKVEKGNRPTDWTPAPEDLEADTKAVASDLESVKTNYVTKSSWETKNEEIAGQVSTVETNTKKYTDGKITQEVTDRNAAITAKANDITLAVSQNYTSKTEFDNLKIGGRNLLRYTDYKRYADKFYQYTQFEFSDDRVIVPFGKELFHGPPYSKQSIGEVIPKGTTVMCSVEIFEQSIPDGNHSVWFSPVRTNGSAFWTNAKTVDQGFVGKIAWLYTLTEDALGFIFKTDTRNGTSGQMIVGRAKVEIGNKTTDWTPAPEDLEEYSETAVANYASRFSVTPENISSEVTALANGSTISTRINQTANAVKIQAGKVDIEGAAIFSSGRLSTSSLNDAYDAKGAADTAKNEAITSSNNNTSTKLQSYSTTSQMNNAITGAIDSLEIGGRNLFRYSDFSNSFIWESISAVLDGNKVSLEESKEYVQRYTYLPDCYIEQGTTVTLSCYIYENTLDNDARFYYSVYPHWHYIPIPQGFTGLWEHTVYITETLTRLCAEYDLRLRTSGKFVVGPPKLEIGNKATTWSPAPEDIEAMNSVKDNLLVPSYDLTAWRRESNVTVTFSQAKQMYNLSTKVAETYTSILGTFLDFAIKPSTVYTLSCDVAYVNGGYASIGIAFYAEDQTKNWPVSVQITDRTTKRYSATVVSGSTAVTARVYLAIKHDASGTDYTAYFSKPKLEENVIATDWTYSPHELMTKKNVHTIMSTYNPTYRQAYAWSLSSYTGNWDLPSTDGIRVGDTVRVGVTLSDMNNAVAYIIVVVEQVQSSVRIYGPSAGLDTTVIDGGMILTGTVLTDRLDADTIKSQIVQTTDLSADRITSGTIDADLIEANSLTIGQVKDLQSTLDDKSNASDIMSWKADVSDIKNENATHTSLSVANGVVTVKRISDAASVYGVYYDLPCKPDTIYSASITVVSGSGFDIRFGGDYGSGSVWSGMGVQYRNTVRGKQIASSSKRTSSTQTFIRIYIGSGVSNSEMSFRDLIIYEGSDVGYFSQNDVESSKTATNYLTQISGTSGISVHDAGDTSNFANMSSEGMKVYKSGTPVAKFGSTVQIGQDASGHVVTTSSGMDVYKDANTKTAEFGSTINLYKPGTNTKVVAIDTDGGHFSGLIDTSSGHIGGWTIDDDSLSASYKEDEVTYNITIDSSKAEIIGEARWIEDDIVHTTQAMLSPYYGGLYVIGNGGGQSWVSGDEILISGTDPLNIFGRIDNRGLYANNIKCGVITGENITNNSHRAYTVRFDKAFPDSGPVPIVVASLLYNSTDSSTADLNVSVASPTRTGCVIHVFNKTGGNRTPYVMWIATTSGRQ